LGIETEFVFRVHADHAGLFRHLVHWKGKIRKDMEVALKICLNKTSLIAQIVLMVTIHTITHINAHLFIDATAVVS
jgi:hypothetical protein